MWTRIPYKIYKPFSSLNLKSQSIFKGMQEEIHVRDSFAFRKVQREKQDSNVQAYLGPNLGQHLRNRLDILVPPSRDANDDILIFAHFGGVLHCSIDGVRGL